MKRFLSIILVFSTLLISACTAGDNNKENNSSVDDSNNIIFSYPVDSSATDFSSVSGESSSKESSDSIDATSEESLVSSADGSIDLSSADTSNTNSSVPDSSIPNSTAPDSSVPESSVPVISSPDITIDPSTPGATWINDLKGQQDTDYHGYTAEELDDYFDDALFVGDSVANGLKLYKSMYEKDIFEKMIFHTGACYGFNNCLSAVSSKSLHPVYQGAQRTIWDMVALTGAKKVFIGFGLNDFGCVTTKNIKNCLDKIISKIRAVNPDIQIILLSSGYFTKAGESYQPSKNDYRTCFRQRDYNQFVLEYCNSLGLDYIDVSNCFADDYGYLDKDKAMDNYCHPHIKHYHLWRDILYGYAADKINGNYTNPERMR